MFAVFFVYLPLLVGHDLVVGERRSHDFWSVQKSGDVIIHGLFPLRERSSSRNSEHPFGFNFDGIIWMGAMIRRISEINHVGSLPWNITLGYNIRDSSSDPNIGLKQSLSIIHKTTIQDDMDKDGRAIHLPVVIGPASDQVQSKSKGLYELFNVARISYTTTSDRFKGRGFVRSAPSDLIHVKALLQLLNNMDCEEISIISSRAKLWKRRTKTFQMNMKKKKLNIRNVVYIDTVHDFNSSMLRSSTQIIVVFAEANVASMLLESGKKRNLTLTWIVVNKFDDPLLTVLDSSGNISNKTIIRNLRQKDVCDYQRYLKQTVGRTSGNFSKETDWLKMVQEKYVEQCQDEIRRMSLSGKKVKIKGCTENAFQEKMKSFFLKNGGMYQSSLTLQGVMDAVNLVASSLMDTLQDCAERADEVWRSCLQSADADYWLNRLTNTSFKSEGKPLRINEHLTLTGNYSIQVLRRTSSPKRRLRTGIPRGWSFKKVREWLITEDLREILDTNKTEHLDELQSDINATSFITERGIGHQANDQETSSSITGTCTLCHESLTCSNCRSEVTVIGWNNAWTIALYSLELFSLFAVILSMLYFFKHRNSPIMILCYSSPDNVVLTVLCFCCLLPIMHIGELTTTRCSILWPVVNIIFAFYSSLLLTKTLFVQNLLKCEVATERPGRRIAFSALLAILQVVILATLSISGFPTVLQFSCLPRRVVNLCDIQGNISVVVSMAYNWLLLLLLCVLTIMETVRQRQNFCRTENLIGVAVVGLISYTCLITFTYVNLQLKHYMLVTLVLCVLYLANPVICLVLIYLPILRLVSTWLRQHLRQKRNLTSIKRAQVMSSKRQSAGPLNSLFRLSFSPDQTLFPSRQSGYYFDLRPPSMASSVSCPHSLVRSVHEPTQVIFGYGRSGAFSFKNCASFDSVHTMDSAEFETMYSTESRGSCYDNIHNAAAAENTESDPSPEMLLHEISTYWDRPENAGIFVNEQRNEDVGLAAVETINNWPSLERLQASDI